MDCYIFYITWTSSDIAVHVFTECKSVTRILNLLFWNALWYLFKSVQNENWKGVWWIHWTWNIFLWKRKYKCVSHFRDSIYNVSFTEIGEIKKRNGYGESDLHYGDGIRNSVWFTFYKIYRLDYQKKVEGFYKKAINLYLQQITGDSNFIWYL